MPAPCSPRTAAVPVVDWHAPWWAPVAGRGAAVFAHWAAQGSVALALQDGGGPAPVRFVPQAALPKGQAYEDFIFQQRAVPTRDNLHDALNGLIWCALPRSKQRMNALQAAEIARDGVQARRGPVRDAITVLDENGALLHAPEALWQALAARRWAEAFGPLRPLWRQAALLVMGHAALEKLVAPYKSITVHLWRVAPPFDPAGDLRALDAWLAADLTPEKLAAKPFRPLPVLGVPGWWPANEDAAFYADARVFRPPRAPDGEATQPAPSARPAPCAPLI